jgi:uncharacterized repeat protein (TIGR01451 family)
MGQNYIKTFLYYFRKKGIKLPITAIDKKEWASDPTGVSFVSATASQGSCNEANGGQKTIRLLSKHTSGFIPNQGQIDHQAKYYLRGSSFQVYFSKADILIVLFEKRKKEKDDPIERIKQEQSKEIQVKMKQKGWVVNIRLVNSNANLKVFTRKEKKGKVNFFPGNDQSKWKTNVPTFEEVVYENVWQNIDLVFLKKDGELKYEFIIKPGADHEDIQLQYTGIDSLSLDEAGNAIIRTPLGDLIDKAPISYQNIKTNKVDVRTSFAISANDANTIKYQVDKEYDQEYLLVIDPGLVYSTYLGGTSDDDGVHIAVDTSGCAYVTGNTSSSNFPTTVGAYDTTYNGEYDVFITKINLDGSGLVYSTYLGGSDSDYAHDIAIDTSGHAYVTGYTYSTNFPTTEGAYDRTFNGYYDAFIIKLTPNGSGLVYSTYLGGSSIDRGYGIVVDINGYAYVAGYTYSSNFPTTAGAYDTTYNGAGDVFITKINQTGNGLVYSTYLGGSRTDDGLAICIDTTGHAYVTGLTYSSNFPTTAGAYDTIFNGGYDVFVTKLTTDGSGLIYSTYLGGTSIEHGRIIVVDSSGCVYVVGFTDSSDFPTTTGAYDTTLGGSRDGFVTKLAPDGSGLIYSTYLGGSSDDNVRNIVIDTTGHAYVTGWTESSNFPTTAGAYDTTYNGAGDVFITKINQTGSGLVYSTYLGGSSIESGGGIAIDTTGHAYVTGWTESSNFPTTAGAYDTTYNGSRDAFITKLNLNIEADLRITKTDYPDPVTVGNELTYTITVTNNGPDNATGVTLTDTLPATVNLISVQTSQGSYSQAGNTLTFQLGTLAAGASATITMVVVPTSPGTVTNRAVLSSAETEPEAVTLDTAVLLPVPVLNVTMVSAPDPVRVGAALTYSIALINQGPGIITGLSLVDMLPAGMEFSAIHAGQSDPPDSEAPVTYNLDLLPGGESALVEIVVIPRVSGVFTNTVTVSGNQTEPQTISVTTTILPALFDSGLFQIAVGKIREFVPTGYFKQDLLQLMAEVEKLARQGRFPEAHNLTIQVIQKIIRYRSGRLGQQFGLNLAIIDLRLFDQSL